MLLRMPLRMHASFEHAEPSLKRYRLTAPHTGAARVATATHWKPDDLGATYLYQGCTVNYTLYLYTHTPFFLGRNLLMGIICNYGYNL